MSYLQNAGGGDETHPATAAGPPKLPQAQPAARATCQAHPARHNSCGAIHLVDQTLGSRVDAGADSQSPPAPHHTESPSLQLLAKSSVQTGRPCTSCRPPRLQPLVSGQTVPKHAPCSTPTHASVAAANEAASSSIPKHTDRCNRSRRGCRIGRKLSARARCLDREESEQRSNPLAVHRKCGLLPANGATGCEALGRQN